MSSDFKCIFVFKLLVDMKYCRYLNILVYAIFLKNLYLKINFYLNYYFFLYLI